MSATWTPDTGPMPALYIGHGAPPLLDDVLWTSQLRALAGDLPRPRAILVISAHWESAPIALSTSGADTPVVYDFGGFDEKYYRMTYPTPDAAELAGLVTSVLPSTLGLHEHRTRGLDHGAWVPLTVMYPDADIPTLQLSIPTHDPATLLELGRRLRPLRESGVLVLASGFLTHGLPYLRDWSPNAAAPGWSVDFDLWAKQALDTGDVDMLAAYRSKAPGMPYAHPTVEHYVPLFVALGAATDPSVPPVTVVDGYWMGLAKRSFVVS